MRTSIEKASNKVTQTNRQLDEAVENLRYKYAKKHLKYFRKLVAEYNTSRHDITILAGNGMATVHIADKGSTVSYWVDRAQANRGVFNILKRIDRVLDWDWAAHLHGERLN